MFYSLTSHWKGDLNLGLFVYFDQDYQINIIFIGKVIWTNNCIDNDKEFEVILYCMNLGPSMLEKYFSKLLFIVHYRTFSKMNPLG